MSFNLSKGSSFNLAKAAPTMKIAGVGLGWDANESPDGPIFDLDVSAFLIGSDGQVHDPRNFVYYGSSSTTVYGDEEDARPYSADGSVLGAIDEIGGGGEEDEGDDGDEEDMRIFFDRVSEDVQDIVVVVTITKYPNDEEKDRRTLDLFFGQVDGCYIRVWNEDTDEELCRYVLSNEFADKDAVEFGRFKRNASGEWNFHATGEGHNGGLMYFIGEFASNL
jgi:tellurium resistance protein TerD